MKKYIIVTLKLALNYGGIMQAYALQQSIRSLGHQVATGYPARPFILKLIAMNAKRKLFVLLGKGAFHSLAQEESLIGKHTLNFVSRRIEIIEWGDVLNAAEKGVDGYIVGSDQVWRQVYAPVEKYLFDFTGDVRSIVRISYAASFGRDDLSEYSPRLLEKSAHLAKRFDGLSVREDSGVKLIKKHWRMTAEQHVDPTLLLEKEHYVKLIKDDADVTSPSKGNLFAYTLDRTGGKGEIINKAVAGLGLQDFEIMPPKAISRKAFFVHPEKYQLPPVTQWLKSFVDAEFVVTDSFHGAVFSIIFNKPFIAIGNKSRGLARFTSLLKTFELEDRLVSDASELTPELMNAKIDWKKVNAIKAREQKRSMKYLEKHLK